MIVVCKMSLLLRLSFGVFLTILLAFSRETKGCDTFNFGQAPHNDDADDSDVESNKTVHVRDWSGRLTRKNQDYTSLEVQWDQPSSGTKVCAYLLHYYEARVAGKHDRHYVVNIAPNVTDYKITNLEMGTSYHFYVEASFDAIVAGSNRKVLQSWVLVTKTLGAGPDNPCNCVPQSTIKGKQDTCNKTTNQCECKDMHTFGKRCEQCQTGYFMNPSLGCVACDNCPKEPAGDGTCKHATGDQMQCMCNKGYTGTHCQKCEHGYYKNATTGDHCLPCNCSGNERKAVKDFCHSEGIYAGHCKACDYHTAGTHCQVCYPGYHGDALSRTCELDPKGMGRKVAVAILIIAIIVITIIILVLVTRRYMRRRRLHYHFWTNAGGGSKSPSGGSTSAVNFTTLMEEPDVVFRGSDRKLEMIGHN